MVPPLSSSNMNKVNKSANQFKTLTSAKINELSIIFHRNEIDLINILTFRAYNAITILNLSELSIIQPQTIFTIKIFYKNAR